jgi:hypothetical protein
MLILFIEIVCLLDMFYNFDPLNSSFNLLILFGGLLQDLREILTSHHIEKYNKNQPFTVISPQLSCISEEKLSQTSSVIPGSPVCQTSIISGSVALCPISNVNENLLNAQSDVLNQCSKQRERMNKGKEMTSRYFESAPVASWYSKGREDKYESAGQRVNPIASHNTSMIPFVHLSRTDKIENKTMKDKSPSSSRVKAAHTSCVMDDVRLCSSEPQQDNVNLNNIPIATYQHETNKSTFNREAKPMHHEPSRFISNVKDSVKLSVVWKNMFRKKCHKTNECIKACGSERDLTNNEYKFKSGSMILQPERIELSENSLLVNSDLGKDKIVSSIKTSLERQNELLHKPREITEDRAEFKKVKEVRGTEDTLVETPKELLHKPEEEIEVSFTDSLQSSLEFQEDKNKKLTARSVPESRSATQEEKNVGTTEIILSQKTEEILDKLPEQTTLADMQSNVHSCSDIVEIQQATVSTVTFRRLCKGTCDMGIVQASVSNDNFSCISCHEEGKLMSDIEGIGAAKSKTSLYKCQEQDECLALEKIAQNYSEITENQQAVKSGASFKVVSKRLHKKHASSSCSEAISLSTSDSAKAGVRNTSIKKVEDFLHKPYKETEISTLTSNTISDSHFIEHKEAASSRKIICIPKRLHNKKQTEVSVSEMCAMDRSEFLETLKHQTRKDVDVSLERVCNKLEKQIESLETNTQSNLGFLEDDIGANFRNSETLGAHKQKEEMGSCAVNNFDSLVKPIDVRSRTLAKKSQEQSGLLKNEQYNSAFVEGRQTVCSRNTVDERVRLNNMQQEELRNRAVSSNILSEPTDGRLRLCSKPHEEFEALKNNAQSESDIVERKEILSSRKITGRFTELHKKQQEILGNCVVNKSDSLAEQIPDKSRTLCKTSEEQIESLKKNLENESDFVEDKKTVRSKKRAKRSKRPYIMMLTAGKSHEAGKTLGKVCSKSDPCSDHDTRERHSDRVGSRDCSGSNVSSSQKHDSFEDRMLASPHDTACAPDIQKYLTTISKDDSSVNSSSCKAGAKISRGVSKMESGKNAEKSIKGFSVTRKPNRYGLDSSMLQQLINEWNSDTEKARSDELLQSDQPSYKDMMSQDLEVITNPSADKIQELLKDWDSNEADDNHEDLRLGEAAVTNGRNQKLSLSVESHKLSKSPLLSHTISVDLQNVGKNTSISKSGEFKLHENSESKYVLNSGSIQEIDAPNNVKSHQLKNLCSYPKPGNSKQNEGLTVMKKGPSSETLDQVSKTQIKSRDNIKTPSRKRRLYSVTGSPEVIELENFDDTSLNPSVDITQSSRGRKRKKKGNVSKPLTKKPRGGGNRQRRKKEVISVCSEGERLGITVSSFGGLSQERELDISKSTPLSMKSFSGRWRNKYLEDVTKRKLEKKCKENVEQPKYSSVYSDIETDSESVISWMENTKPKRLEFVQKPKITYERKRRAVFPSKQKMKQALCSKHHSSQPPLPRKEKSGTRPKIKEHILSKLTTEKYISLGKKASEDHNVETFVTHAVENQLPDVDLFRSNENEQFEETVPVEINILPCLDGAATSYSTALPPLIKETEHSAGSKITPVRKKELLNEKRVKKRNVENTDKSTDNRNERSYQCGFNFGLASSDADASNSQMIASSRNFSKLACMKRDVNPVFVRQEYISNDNEEVPDCTGNNKMQTGVTSEEPNKYLCGSLLGAHETDMGENENLCMGRAGSNLSDKIVEICSNLKGTKCDQNVPSTFCSPSNMQLNFTSEKSDEIESLLPAKEVDVCPISSQSNRSSSCGTSVVGCEDDFEEFCKQFLKSSEEEMNPFGNLECNNMTVKKGMLDDQKRGREKVCGKKADGPVTVAPYVVGGIGDYDIKDCEEENMQQNVPCHAVELEQPSVPCLPSFYIENANSSDNDLLSPFNPVCASSFLKGDWQSFSPVVDSSLSKGAEKPSSSNTESYLKSQVHINDSLFSERDRQSISPNFGLPYSERFQKPLGQINMSVSNRNEQPSSPFTDLLYSKRVQKPLSPCGTRVVPVSPISIPSLTTEAGTTNIPVSAPLPYKRMAQYNREVLQEDTVPSQQLSGVEDSDMVGGQGFSSLQIAERVSKSKKNSKKNTRHTSVSKQREKCKKKNTSMDLTTDGTSTHDGRTVIMQEITGADGK